MASLLTEAEKTTLNSAMEDHHDTFARPITVFKDAVVSVSSPSPSYNTIYGNAGATQSKTYTTQSSTVNARILYNKVLDEDYLEDGLIDSQLKLKLDEGAIRLKIKASDLSTLKESKRIEFDNRKFYIDSDFRGHGLFDSQFYTFFVKPLQ